MLWAIQELDDFLLPHCERWHRLGQLYGYPTTAIDGFVQERSIVEEDVLPEVFKAEEILAFFATRPFRLSQSHWRAEAEVVRRWIATLKKVAPITYGHILHCQLRT